MTWMKTTLLGRAFCFAQSSDSNANLIYKHLHSHPQNVWSKIWPPQGLVRLIYKTNHNTGWRYSGAWVTRGMEQVHCLEFPLSSFEGWGRFPFFTCEWSVGQWQHSGVHPWEPTTVPGKGSPTQFSISSSIWMLLLELLWVACLWCK